MCDTYLGDSPYEAFLKSLIATDCNCSMVISKWRGVKCINTEYSNEDVVVDVVSGDGVYEKVIWTGSIVEFVSKGIYQDLEPIDCFEVKGGKLVIYLF